MPVWRCPHCGTPQAESARCWVCRRSTTSCASCRHFRRAVANGLGMCGLDPRHVALIGSEMHACWTAPDPAVEAAAASTGPASIGVVGTSPDGGERRPRTFVPVEDLVLGREPVAVMVPDPVVAAPHVRIPGAWMLWGDELP